MTSCVSCDFLIRRWTSYISRVTIPFQKSSLIFPKGGGGEEGENAIKQIPPLETNLKSLNKCIKMLYDGSDVPTLFTIHLKIGDPSGLTL